MWCARLLHSAGGVQEGPACAAFACAGLPGPSYIAGESSDNTLSFCHIYTFTVVDQPVKTFEFVRHLGLPCKRTAARLLSWRWHTRVFQLGAKLTERSRLPAHQRRATMGRGREHCRCARHCSLHVRQCRSVKVLWLGSACKLASTVTLLFQMSVRLCRIV